MLAALEALPFTGYLVREPGVYALVFGAGDRAALLAWRSEGQTALEVPVLPTARVVTLDVRPVALSAEGEVSLTLGPVPVFVSGVGAALVEEAKAALAQRGPLLPVVPAERDFSQSSEVSLRLGRETVERGLYSVLRARRNGAVEAVEVNGEGGGARSPRPGGRLHLLGCRRYLPILQRRPVRHDRRHRSAWGPRAAERRV